MGSIRTALMAGICLVPAWVAAQTDPPRAPVSASERQAPASAVPLESTPADAQRAEGQMASGKLFCPNLQAIQQQAVYPPGAISLKLPRVTIRMYFVIDTDNEIRDIRIQAPDNAASKAFQEVAASMVTRLKCVNRSGHDQPVAWAVDFALQ